MTTRQRIVIGIGALLVAARVFFPASKCGYEPFASVPQCVSLTVTILHVIGIAVLTWLTAVIFPWPWWIIDTWWRLSYASRVRLAFAGIALLVIIVAIETRYQYCGSWYDNSPAVCGRSLKGDESFNWRLDQWTGHLQYWETSEKGVGWTDPP